MDNCHNFVLVSLEICCLYWCQTFVGISFAFIAKSCVVPSCDTPQWLASHDVGQYEHEGITRDVLYRYIQDINNNELKKEREHIISVLHRLR